ncbi:MAG TPA: type II toxin-antitoxin system PemK/MazF family toxin [Thiobacillaceae bacterium]|nr:type II toxin-antitoxin system PemK/MazF family toxin [Thiobacillaceae bacterium]
MDLKRGDIVTVALEGIFGQTRPALVMQSDLFASHESIVVLPVTSDLLDAPLFRINVQPDADNGLQAPAQIMADKPQCIPRDAISEVTGKLDADTLAQADKALSSFLGIA